MIDQPTRITRQLSRAAVNLENIFTLYKKGEMVEMVERYFKPIVYCDKMLPACKKADHPFSIAKVIMKKLKGQEELDQFYLTRAEYANELGKTPNAVRMMMRQGKLSGEYRFDGSKYIFRSSKRPRENYDNDHPVKVKLTTPKKVNRGNHFKADYPNEAFRLHNQYKKEQAILNKIQGKFKSEAHRIEYEKLNDEALKKSLENTQKKLEQKAYIPPVRPSYPTIDREDYNSSPVFRKPFRGYDNIGNYDDGSIEIDISRSTGNSVINEPRFKSKVAESIWRLKNKK